MVRSTVFGVLRILLMAPIPLLLTPFIVRHIGAPGLGVWGLFIAINNLTSAADLGFHGALTKHVSEYVTRRDYRQLNHTLNSGMLMVSLTALSLVAAMNLGGRWIIAAFLQHAPASHSQLQ